MFRGSKVVLRSRLESDVPILHRDLYEDVPSRVRADNSPGDRGRPQPSPFKEPAESPDKPHVAVFTVADPRPTNPSAPACCGTSIYFNRNAHIGLSFRPVARGRGLAGETLQLLCRYGFEIPRSGSGSRSRR